MKPHKSSYQQVDSEERYQRLFETAQDGILILDASSGKILDANPFIAKLTGYSKEELMDKYIWDLGFFKNIVANKDKFIELQKKGYVRYENLPIETKQGERHYVEFISNSYLVGSFEVIQCNIRDISSRVRLEKINSELSMMYQVILRCNQVLIHEVTANALITQMCRVLVSSGGFLAAWVGYTPVKSEDLIHPIAAEGIDADYFDMMNSNIEHKEPNWLVLKGIYSNKLFACQDLQHEEQNITERELALKYGFNSMAVIPIKSLKLTPYILVVYGHYTHELTDDLIALLHNLASDIAFGIDNLEAHADYLKLVENIDKSLNNTISAIASMVEQRDPYTAGHQRRVANLAVAIATDMGLSADQIIGLRMACVVHDIGKIHIPAEILSKPALLSEAEYEIIKTHPKAGWEVLKNIDFPWPIAEMVYQHHERLDGSGYPRGLKDNEILLESRILMVADVVDAMSSHRPYRPALGILQALQEIMQHKGTLYDERVVDACVKLFIEKKFEIK
jgi:PAS domain S-box-containing protein/putative nucleotidyltransferase with HDIG domain